MKMASTYLNKKFTSPWMCINVVNDVDLRRRSLADGRLAGSIYNVYMFISAGHMIRDRKITLGFVNHV